MTSLHPIEIIGGGLAGLALGLALRRAGVPVQIFEAGAYPRHRVCGEFITGLPPSTIARLGLAPHLTDALSHREIAWFFERGRPHFERLPAPALGLSRHALDARLAAAFVAAGGELHTRTRVTDLAARPGRVFATGRNPGRPAWLGLKVHARNLPLERDLELHLGRAGYVGLARVETGAINVCGLFRRQPIARLESGLLPAYLRANGLDSLAARLEAAELEPDSFCAVAALRYGRHLAGGKRVCLGDAGAMMPPFTGHGMAMALQGAELALDPLLAFAKGNAAWANTGRTIGTALRRRFRRRLAFAGVFHSFLLQPARRRWFAALCRSRLLPFRLLYSALH